MSLWPTVISLFLGVMASVLVPLPIVWPLVLLLLALFLLAAVYFREKRFEALFLICCVLIGWGDTAVNLEYFCGPDEQPLQKHYRAPTVPSASVVWLETRFSQSSLTPSHRAELHAMMFADKTQLTSEQRSLFQYAGAQHLLALSGTHLGILLGICYFLFLRRFRFTRYYWIVLLGVLAFLWFYTLMVGTPQSLRRAMFMATFFLLGSASFRSTRADEILASSVCLMLLVDPLCAFDVGAELSVAAMIGLVFLFPLIDNVIPRVPVKKQLGWTVFYRLCYRFLKWLWGLFSVSLSAWLFTMPLVLFYFGQVQLWQIVTGIVLVPATMFVLYLAVLVLLLCVCGWMPPVMLCSTMLDRLMDWHDWLLERCGELPFAYVRTQPISFMQLILLYGMVINVLVAWKFPSRSIILRSLFYVIMLSVLFCFV